MGNIYHTNWIYNYFKEKYGWKKELILKNIDETINYFIEKINQFDLISKKQKGLYGFKLCWILILCYLF